MTKVIVYVDGFNLYHALSDLNDNRLKWLDLWSLSQSLIRDYQTLEAVKYFSAYATWMPGRMKRHQIYVAALEAQGVTPVLGRFKMKFVRCQANCRQQYVTHEEKETDVNIGVHLMADALRDRFDTALVVSADTDIAAAISHTLIEAPEKKILVAAPPGRFGRAREMEPAFEITKGKIRGNLLPDTVQLSDGKIINKPTQYG